MTIVYVAVALIDYEPSTVLAVFDDYDAAWQYLRDYKSHEGAPKGPDYKPNYDHYDVIDVELNATPFRSTDFPENRPLL